MLSDTLAAGDGQVFLALPYYEVFVRTLVGDRDEALRQLTQYLAAQPERRSELAND